MPSAAEVWYTCVKILRLAVFGCWGWLLWPWQLDKEKEGEARRPGLGSLPAVWPGQSTSPFLAIGSPGKRGFNDMRCCIPNVNTGPRCSTSAVPFCKVWMIPKNSFKEGARSCQSERRLWGCRRTGFLSLQSRPSSGGSNAGLPSLGGREPGSFVSKGCCWELTEGI